MILRQDDAIFVQHIRTSLAGVSEKIGHLNVEIGGKELIIICTESNILIYTQSKLSFSSII